MRCEPVLAIAAAIRAAIRAAIAAAIVLGAAGCTSRICSRSSDCTTGYMCTSRGTCEMPADASIDGAAGSSDGATQGPIDAQDTTDAADDGDL